MMRWWFGLLERMRALLFRTRFDADLNDELQFHLDQSTQRNIARGMTPGDAQRAAHRSLGNLTLTKDDVRTQTGVHRLLGWVDTWWLDVKLGFRMIAKYPGLSVVGVMAMTVAVAIGAGYFDFFKSILRDPPPPLANVVSLRNRDVAHRGRGATTLYDFVTWRDHVRSVEALGAFRDMTRNLTGGAASGPAVVGAAITPSAFRLMGVPPMLGRHLHENDTQPGAQPVVVIGYDLWRTRFESDTGVVGRDVGIGSTVHTVVGVMPEGFAFPAYHRFWTPMSLDPSPFREGEGPPVQVFGRLGAGVTPEAAQAELTAVGLRTAAALPDTHGNVRPFVGPYARAWLGADDPGLWWQVGIVQIVLTVLLLVPCVNVAILVYARTATRQGELAVRTALGASRRRLVIQLFLEAFVLALLAAGVGLWLAQKGLQLGPVFFFTHGTETGLPYWIDMSVSPATILYIVILAVAAAAVAGIAPAVHATGRGAALGLRQADQGAGIRLGRKWTALIVVQVAFTVAILPPVVAATWSGLRSTLGDPGIAEDAFLTAELWLDSDVSVTAPGASNPDPGDRLHVLGTELVERFRSEPGVSGATFATGVPGLESRRAIELDGVAPPPSGRGHRVAWGTVDVDFFRVLDLRLLAGRPFQPSDLDTAGNAVVVNQAFVRHVLAGGNPLGHRLRRVRYGNGPFHPWYRIVGVVEDLPRPGDLAVTPATIYRPTAFGPMARLLLVRTDPSAAGRIRDVTTSLDPMLRLNRLLTLREAFRTDVEQVSGRLVAMALALATVMVVLLSAAGIYALISVTVTQRRREIGVRVALGAESHQVLRSTCSKAFAQLALGGMVGAAAALWIVTSVPFHDMDLDEAGIGFANLVEFVPLVALGMVAVGVVAAAGPARRALRVHPTETLKET